MTMLPNLKISLFGRLEVWQDGELLPDAAFGRKKTRHLLKILASERGRNFPKDQLIDALFPDLSPDKAAVNLSGRVGELRRALEPDLEKNVDSRFVLTKGQGYVFSLQEECQVDLEEFTDHIKQGREYESAKRWSQAQVCYENAVDLYRDSLFADDPYEEWTLAPRQRFETLYLEALSHLAECLSQLEAYPQAIECCQKALRIAPTRESVYRQQIQYQSLAGWQERALETYDDCINMLKDLGVEASPETRLLYLQIQKHAHTTLPKAKSVNHNLPSQSTCFVGREGDLQSLSENFQRNDCRLLTILGQGGLGKTQLAIHFAHAQLSNFEDGVYLIPLSSSMKLDDMLVSVAEAIRFKFQGRQAIKDQLLDYLSNQNILLILDSFEHVLASVDWLAALLDNTSKLSIVTTSRERLNIKGEWAYSLESLSVPKSLDDPDTRTYSSVALFLEQANRIFRPVAANELEQVTRICQLVEGLPLGIELAASWLDTLGCDEIAREIETSYDFLTTTLQDMPDRHRSLRAVFEQSWSMLTEKEREILTGIAVFQGKFDRHAAQQVAQASLPILSALIHKSLLKQTADQRYSLHEVLRQFILEKAEQYDEHHQACQTRHGRFFSAFMAQRQPDLKGGRQKEALLEMNAYSSDIQAAWRWLLEIKAEGAVRDMLESFYLYYEKQGLFLSGKEAFEVAKEPFEQNPELLAILLTHQAALCYRLGELDTTADLIQRGLEHLTPSNNPVEVAFAHQFLGDVAMMRGEFNECKTHLETSHQLYKEANDISGVAATLNELGIWADKTGDLEAAKKFYKESLALKRKTGDLRGRATTLLNLGYVAFHEGDYNKTEKFLEECQGIFKEINDRLGIAISTNNLADVADKRGQYEDAIELYQECVEYCGRIGDQIGVAIALVNMANTRCRIDQVDEAQMHYPEALQIALDIGAHPIALDAMLGYSSTLKTKKQYDQAFELVTFAMSHPALESQLEKKAQRLFDELSEYISDGQVQALQAGIKDWDLDAAAKAVYQHL